MSSPTLPGRVAADHSALTRLLACDLATFQTSHWAQAALLSRRADRGGEDFADLFSLDAVDELLSSRGLRTPFLRMAKNGKTLPESAYTIGGGIGAGVRDQISDDAVLSLFADGATVVLQGLHRTWKPITRWSQDLAGALGHPVQVNAYVTPPANQGFADHYDVHDVFVLQVHGQKRWSIHEPVLHAPLRDQPWADRRMEVEAAAAQPATVESTLEPGDCLYLPRGYIHSAAALGGVSIHLTVGVHGWTRHHIAEALLTSARSGLSGRREIRESLALGVDVASPDSLADDIEVTREALIEAVREASAAEVGSILAGQARAAQRPESIAPVSLGATLADLVPADTLRHRGHLMAHAIEAGHGSVVIRSRAGRFTVPAEQTAAVAVFLGSERVTVSELDDDENVALAAARLLVRHGVAVPVDA
ncbi:MAG: cupin domain-containing protein [Ornithinimicrobium sp.]